MNTDDFLKEILASVTEFCTFLDANPPAYCYIPLRTDEQRLRVMKSRLFNELRAAELFGTWLRTTPELDVKATMAESAHEEMVHAELLSKRIRDLGAEPFDYKPLPAQIAMFNAMEGLNDTCERIAGLSLAGETVANYLIQICLRSPDVPEWIKQPYRRITKTKRGTAACRGNFSSATRRPKSGRIACVARSRCGWFCFANIWRVWTAGRCAKIGGRFDEAVMALALKHNRLYPNEFLRRNNEATFFR